MVKIGVLGGYRGTSMINYCAASSGKAKVVAICDNNPEVLERQKKIHDGEDITFYDDFNDFIEHDMDAVVLANYANEHAPFAIRCLKKGLHVFSEVLPCQCMAEAVELIEAAEESGKVYAYGENYCFMPVPREMRRLYKEGRIGEIEYAEGEYIHNCESIWPSITYGERDHWRNRMFATFYCTHSLGPMIHISGLRPVSVVGFEGTKNERRIRSGSFSGQFGIEMVTLENGAILKSIHGDLYTNSIWYAVYGSKGRMEADREAAGVSDTLYLNADRYSGEYSDHPDVGAFDVSEKNDVIRRFGHGGSDYYIMDAFVDKINGVDNADVIDVYEAMDMFIPGLLAYRSVLNGGAPVAVPDLRDPAVRDKYRDDRACCDPTVAKEQLLPSFSKGNPDIPDSVYDEIKRRWEAEKNDGAYVKAAMSQGSLK